MKYSEIAEATKPFEELCSTIPENHLQGRKVAFFLLGTIKEDYELLASLYEENAYLRQELYGKKKNKKQPDSEADSENSDDVPGLDDTGSPSENKPSMSDAKKNLASSRLKQDLAPTGKVETQKVRKRVPKDLICGCCDQPIRDLGLCQKTSETEFVPAKIVEREILLHRGACGCGEIDFVSPRPKRILSKRPYTSTILTKLINDRYRFHLPIYRQTKQFRDMGCEISQSTLNELVLSSWNKFAPIVSMMWDQNKIQEYRYLYETPICRVVDKKVSKRHYLWGMYTDLAITFEVTATRNQDHAERISGKGGTVLTDGHSVYCEKTIDGKHANCLAHLAQQLFKAFPSFPEEANHAIEIISAVYAIDKQCKIDELAPNAVLEIRQEQMKPLMESLRTYLEGLNVPPRSSMGKAIKYAKKRWTKLCLFLKDGILALDNNKIESIFKDVKLGMKNGLFVQSKEGGEALAGLNSIIATCELHGINPSTYIEQTLEKLADGWPKDRIEELLPWNFVYEPRPKYDPNEKYIEDTLDPEEFIKVMGLEGKVRYDPERYREVMGTPKEPPVENALDPQHH